MTKQADPTLGKVDVSPIALNLFLETFERQEKAGIETYGTTLQTHNGRSCYRDALEEMVDSIKYLVQGWLESQDKDREITELSTQCAEQSKRIHELETVRLKLHDENQRLQARLNRLTEAAPS